MFIPAKQNIALSVLLNRACASGDVEEMRSLLARGDMRAKSERPYFLPLRLAGSVQACRVLQEAGADIDELDAAGRLILGVSILARQDEKTKI